MATALVACGGDDKPAVQPSPTFDATAAQSDVKANWLTFFNAKTPEAQRLALLQDAAAFKVGLRKAAKQEGADTTTATVKKVVIDPGNKTATVTYDLFLAGNKVIADGTAQAVLDDDGTWKVSKSAFCGLLGQVVQIKACA